jgi:hypothetical protein
MNPSDQSLKKTARLTGLLYFLFAAIAIYGYMYVSPKIMVPGNTRATSVNMLANEFLFRTSIAGDIVTNILFITVIILLYRIFRPVNEFMAGWMAWLAFVAIPVSFIGEALQLTALQVFKGKLLSSFSTAQAQDIAATLLKAGNYTSQLITFHWGLWLMPMGLLVYRSGFIPRIFGILLLINGMGYMISSITFILFPDALKTVNKLVYPSYFIGEVPLIFWLLIKGTRPKKLFNKQSNG